MLGDGLDRAPTAIMEMVMTPAMKITAETEAVVEVEVPEAAVVLGGRVLLVAEKIPHASRCADNPS